MKPSVIPSVYEISKRIMSIGLSWNDLITLIQRETKLSRRNIESTLIALRNLEKKITS